MGKLVIISGPAGVGKDTVINEIIQKQPSWMLHQSTVTRTPRDNETEGNPYHFISESEFVNKILNCEFLEWNQYASNYYGTDKIILRDELETHDVVILRIDVNGFQQIQNKFKNKDILAIFITPPSLDELRKRLANRNTESEDEIKYRMQIAMSEMKTAKHYSYIIENDDLQNCVNQVITTINLVPSLTESDL